MKLIISREVAAALESGGPIVALESAVITHGLPSPINLECALALEGEVRAGGATPGTVAFINHEARVGLSGDELAALAHTEAKTKVSPRDVGVMLAGLRAPYGGTTVAGTILLAQQVGLRVFATGGIGGVHRGASSSFDISADLPMLARTPMLVVCSGAKAILDLPATREWLETAGIPVLGWQTDELPAFYSRESGLPVDLRVESVAEVVAVARAHWGAGLPSAVLLTVPPPANVAIPADEIRAAISHALSQSRAAGVQGREVTPYLLDAMREATAGRSMTTNVALLRNNAAVAAAVAVELYR